MYPAAVPIFRKFGDTLETLAISEAVSPAGGAHADSEVDQAGHRRPRSPKNETGHSVGHRGKGLRSSDHRSEEHTSELQSLMRISYAVFCLKKQNKNITQM